MDKGAHYHACDFQVHSPLDGGWKGKGNASDEERRAYARSLITACRSSGLQAIAIAITDHHEMGFLPFVREAATAERDADGRPLPAGERLVIFPGMELTLGVPCQALLIFDADFPEDLFSLARTALAIPPDSGGGVARLDHIQSLVALKVELDKHTYLKGRYTVFPNVSDGGSATLIRKGQAGKYIEMPFAGGYVDGGFAKLGDGNRNILSGEGCAVRKPPHRGHSDLRQSVGNP